MFSVLHSNIASVLILTWCRLKTQVLKSMIQQLTWTKHNSQLFIRSKHNFLHKIIKTVHTLYHIAKKKGTSIISSDYGPKERKTMI